MLTNCCQLFPQSLCHPLTVCLISFDQVLGAMAWRILLTSMTNMNHTSCGCITRLFYDMDYILTNNNLIL